MPNRDVIPRVMLWALTLAGTAILALATALFATHATGDQKYREFNDGRVDATARAVQEIRQELALKRQTDERQELLLRAIAKKLNVSVTEVEESR